jgi:cytochrome c oxidase subunit 4
MSDAHTEDIKKHVKTYLMVFGTLMALTVLTVGVSYMRLAVPIAIVVALLIATVKGSLVAAYFMHLLHERPVIFYVLALTVIFFVFLMFIPLLTIQDKIVYK